MPTSVPMAASRFAGAYLGAVALAVTYVVAIARGVSTPAALWRAFLAWAVCTLTGRAVGWIVGRQLGPRPAHAPAAALEPEGRS